MPIVREGRADPQWGATVKNLSRGRPTPYPTDPLTKAVDPFGVSVAPKRERSLKLEDNGILFDVSDIKGDVLELLFRKPSTPRSNQPTGRIAILLGNEPTSVFVRTFLPPLFIQRYHSDVWP